MPSVMTTASGMAASIASTTADFANAGGTKMTETLAPVSFIASATVPYTGTETPPSNSTVVPALRGLTPPTIEVPEASMRCVCFMPSEPVMPWTMTLEFSSRKIAIVVFSRPLSVRRGRSQLGGLAGRPVHGLFDGHERVVGLGEDAPALLHVVAVEAHDQRLGRLVAERLEGTNDAVGDGVAGGDATEHVDEHRLDLLVAEDDVQAVGHDLGRGAATDVEEVGGLGRAGELLTGVGDDVERRHDQARAVADDADGAVELDVVEALGLRGSLERVGRGLVLERLVVGVAEVGVLVERDLAVEGDDVAFLGLHQRVDLHERGVLVAVDLPEPLQDGGDLRAGLGVEPCGLDDLGGLGRVDAGVGVDRDAREGLGALDRELLDLHTALLAAHREVGAVGPVEQDREVVLLGDARALGDHHGAHGVALDVHAEDGLGVLLRLVGALGDLHAAGLAATAGLHLGLDDGDPAALGADGLGGFASLLGGGGGGAGQHGYAVLLEHVSSLVLEKI